MTLAITYSLVGTGWSSCQISAQGTTCEISASYLSDALGNLVLSALAACSGFQTVAFGFDEEPGKYRWVLTRVSGTELRLEILKFADLWTHAPNSAGTSIFVADVPVREFAQAVLDAAATVLSTHGIAGYKEKWVEYDFPLAGFTQLQAMLGKYPNDA